MIDLLEGGEETIERDFKAVISINANQEINVLYASKDCGLVDLFMDGYDGDNNGIWLRTPYDFGKCVGLYEVNLYPWSEYDAHNGDYDGGIHATITKTIWEKGI